MEQIVIKADHINKAYKLYEKKSDRLREVLFSRVYHRPFIALDDISFEIKKGETIGIIGTNGSGKSTLLKILTGVVTPSSGSFFVKGRVSALLELGAGFNPEYTGLENIDLNGTMMGFSTEELNARRDSIIQFADIGDYINQPVKNYSSGMFARLAFAVAISIEPDILIVDEALSVGDVFFQNKCFRKFEELTNKGVTILFVSHDIPTVRKMCSKVLWIEKGIQKMFGESNDVCNEYFNLQTMRLNQQNQAFVDNLDQEQISIQDSKQGLIQVPRILEKTNSLLSQKAQILSVYVRDEAGHFTSNMKADSNYTVGVVSRFNESLDNIIIGFTLSNRKGIVMLACNTFINGDNSLHANSNEIIEATFSFTMPRFRNDEYEISPAIAQGTQENHVNLTWLHEVLSVNVIRSGYEIADLDLPYDVHTTVVDDVILF